MRGGTKMSDLQLQQRSQPPINNDHVDARTDSEVLAGLDQQDSLGETCFDASFRRPFVTCRNRVGL